MVLEWTPKEARLLQDRPFSAAVSVYISSEAWETQNHQTFSSISLLGTLGPGDSRLCTRLVLVSFTLIYSCPIIHYETLHDRPFCLIHLKRASETDIFLLGTRAPRDRYHQTCACVIHIYLHTLSAACALVLSSWRGTCAS